MLVASLLMAQSPTAVNGVWRVSKLAGKSVSKRIKPPRVEFSADGRVAGFGGCNRFGGSYTVNGTQLKLGELVATRMACAGDGMKIEDQFFQVFAGELKMRAFSDRLDLINSSNQVVLRLQRDR